MSYADRLKAIEDEARRDYLSWLQDFAEHPSKEALSSPAYRALHDRIVRITEWDTKTLLRTKDGQYEREIAMLATKACEKDYDAGVELALALKKAFFVPVGNYSGFDCDLLKTLTDHFSAGDALPETEHLSSLFEYYDYRLDRGSHFNTTAFEKVAALTHDYEVVGYMFRGDPWNPKPYEARIEALAMEILPYFTADIQNEKEVGKRNSCLDSLIGYFTKYKEYCSAENRKILFETVTAIPNYLTEAEKDSLTVDLMTREELFKKLNLRQPPSGGRGIGGGEQSRERYNHRPPSPSDFEAM